MSSNIREWNLVAHKVEGTSDKVYMACIRETYAPNGNVSYAVLGKWGRRGKKLSSQVKWAGALEPSKRMQRELFDSKLAEGYIDVDSGSYRGPVSRSNPEIHAELEGVTIAKPPVTISAKVDDSHLENKRMATPNTHNVICINRIGMEERFDDGIEYVWERHTEKKMLWVWDKFGVKSEYFIERFKFVKED
jgi:hypothetical protein